MKFYILWSDDLGYLVRHFENHSKDDTEVVINTLDDYQRTNAVNWCNHMGVTHHVTESDGTPATGKNSVLKIFLESDNDYMVQIDGDDYLTPHGIYLYKELAKHPSPPDMVALYKQVAVMPEGGLSTPFDRSNSFWNAKERAFESYPTRHDWIRVFMQDEKYLVDQKTATEWADARIEYDELMHLKMEDSEFMCRMVFHSRKVAELMHYNNAVEVGEDTLQFLPLKRLALEGSIKMMRRKERENNPTYLYDYRYGSIMRGKYHYKLNWIRPFLNELKKLGEFADNKSLEEFRDEEWVSTQTN